MLSLKLRVMLFLIPSKVADFQNANRNQSNKHNPIPQIPYFLDFDKHNNFLPDEATYMNHSYPLLASFWYTRVKSTSH